MTRKFIPLVIMLFMWASSFSQAPRLVLFEEFTGENCGPCAGTNPYVQTLIDQYPNNVLWVRYQCNIPTPGLIYYQDQTDVNTRLSYYGVNSAPWGQQDGTMWDSSLVSNWGNQPITWCADTNTGALKTTYLVAEDAITSPFTIGVSYHLSANADSFYTTVTVTGAESYKVSQTGKLKLHVAMMENLSFLIAPGTNGEKDFPDVVRKMYPSAAGTTLPDSSYTGLVQTFHFSGLVPGYIYDKSQIRFVAFIQDDNGKHVQQAGVSLYDTLALDAKAVNVNGSFVVCDTSYQPSFNFANNGLQTLTSALITVKLDAAPFTTINWTGSLAPGSSTTVNVHGLGAVSTGVHKLSAVINNPNGSADNNMHNDTAYFSFAIAPSVSSTPLVQGFETTYPGWVVDAVTGSPYTWSQSTPGDNSSNSFVMDFWDAAPGAINNLYAPPVNFTGISSPRMKFSLADAQYDFGGGQLSKDSLYINVSTDCGATWTTVYANGGTGMATGGAVASAFTPTAAQWVNDSVDLSVAANHNDIIIMFNTVSGNGNNLYIDNINIYDPSAPSAISTITNINSLSVFPNPAMDLLNIRLQLAQSTEVSYEVTNALGQVLMATNSGNLNAGSSSLTVNTASLPAGVYCLSVIAGNERTSKMFAVIH